MNNRLGRVLGLGLLLAAVTAFGQVDEKRSKLPAGRGIALGPYVQYLTPDSATVHWETAVACPTALSYGTALDSMRDVTDPALKTRHSVVVDGLVDDTVYLYTITALDGLKAETSEPYVFDTTFNYTPKPIPADVNPYGPDLAPYTEAAEQILALSGVRQGYCVVYGNGNGRLALALAKASELTVVGLDADNLRVQASRQALRSAQAYGERVTVRRVESMDDVPLTRYAANLVVSEAGLDGGLPGHPGEAYRLLRPGGVLLIEGANADAWADRLPPAETERIDGWLKVVRGPLESSGRWTHQYGDPANTANSGDTLAGAGGTTDMEVQWFGRPGADFGIDRNPRMPAPLSVNGRLFHQGLNRMVGLDAYNGAILWLLEIPGLRRVNIPRDASNWCADDNHLYTLLKNACWRIDAQTGVRTQTYTLPAADEPRDWGYVARYADLLYGSAAKRGSSYTEFWGKSAWYDAAAGPGTHQVCSENLFAKNLDSGETVWSYANGKIINTTICIGGGRVFFIESRHPKLNDLATSRIDAPELWLDQYLVALDANTGTLLYEEPIDTEDGIVIFFMVYANDMLLIDASLKGNYHVYGFNARDGKQAWYQAHKWPGGDHSGHMQRMTVARNVVYVEPRGYDIATGQIVTDRMGRREGCSTVVATSDALIYRGQARRVSMWDIDEERVTSWPNLRPSCWLSVIPAGGMLLAPEGGGGCSCGNWVETSLGFLPR